MRGLSTKTQLDLQRILDRLARGDSNARDALVERSVQRLRELAHRELGRFPRLRRWEQTDDILQGAVQRLIRALRDVKPPTPRDFFNLSTAIIRRELIDLQRAYYGPRGRARRHATPRPDSTTRAHMSVRHDPGGDSDDPHRLAELSEFHQRVEQLPDDENEIFSLIWYQGLSREQAAEVLGVSVRTVGRRWREARLRLGEFV